MIVYLTQQATGGYASWFSIILMYLVIILFFFVLYKIVKKVTRFMDDVHDIAKSKKTKNE